MANIKVPKKLIEVALPLDDINVAAAREKSIRQGHPSSLHLWWARRPLVAARAILFAQLVNDPGYERYLGRGVNKEKASKERDRLFNIIRELVRWENINNEGVLKQAREEIWKSWRETCALNKDHPNAAELFNSEKLPAFHDPFAGGGAIPLEAQRLGLESHASDLNPVAVIINKAMIEIPTRFFNCAPVGSILHDETQTLLEENWTGAKGIAEDVRRYGRWMRNEAYNKLKNLYPQIEITKEMIEDRPDLRNLLGEKLTVISWLWARTVKSPNPAYSHIDVPLSSTFVLCSKKGREAFVEPIIEKGGYHFVVKIGKIPESAECGTKAQGRGANFICLLSQTPITGDYIKKEGQEGRLGAKLIAVVAEGVRGRIYLKPSKEQEMLATSSTPAWKPNGNIPPRLTGGTCVPYGLKEWGDLFTARQLVTLTVLSDLIEKAILKIKEDAEKKGLYKNGKKLNGGDIAKYAQSVGVYLAFIVNRLIAYNCTLSIWRADHETAERAFGRQSIPMIWDYSENNPFSGSGGNFNLMIESVANALLCLPEGVGIVEQKDAQTQEISGLKIISTDPPYYDNIAYADLSDFFYVWLRRSLRGVYPELFTTIVVPKTEELVATAYRHDSKEEAEKFFLDGMTQAMQRLSEQAHLGYPVTIYYAFKQAETKDEEGTSSTGWETFLDAVIKAGFSISGTWPIRTEQVAALKAKVNALASSIILVCRKRSPDAQAISRREFIRELNTVLPEALLDMTCGGDHSPVAPVDLSQAIIGPGMAVFSKYSAILEADGKPMTVRTALQLINRFLAEDDFDHDTQFCLHWFETVGWSEGRFGEADVLARAKGTSVDGVKEAGVVSAGAGKVRLLKWNEYPADWNPENDFRLPVWEGLHHLIRALRTGGETAAAGILGKLGTRIEAVRQLAYRLYTLCERNGWAEDARAYNELIATWQAIEAVAPKTTEKQMDLF